MRAAQKRVHEVFIILRLTALLRIIGPSKVLPIRPLDSA